MLWVKRKMSPVYWPSPEIHRGKRQKENRASGLLLRVLDTLKGLSHEIEIENVHENLQILALIRPRLVFELSLPVA
jgi:hypothetical protein